MIYRSFAGILFRKSTRSGAGNDCIYLPVAGRPFRKASASGTTVSENCVCLPVSALDAVADSKTDSILSVNAAGLVAFAKRR